MGGLFSQAGSGRPALGDIPPELRVRPGQVPLLVWIAARAYLPLPVALVSLPAVLLIGLLVLALGGRVLAAPGAVLTMEPWPRPRRPRQLVCIAAGGLLLPGWVGLLLLAAGILPLLGVVAWRALTQRARVVERAAQSAATAFAAAGCRVVVAENLAAWPRRQGRGFALLGAVLALTDRWEVCTVAAAADDHLAAKYVARLGFELVNVDEPRVVTRHCRGCPRGAAGGHTASPGGAEPA